MLHVHHNITVCLCNTDLADYSLFRFNFKRVLCMKTRLLWGNTQVENKRCSFHAHWLWVDWSTRKLNYNPNFHTQSVLRDDVQHCFNQGLFVLSTLDAVHCCFLAYERNNVFKQWWGTTATAQVLSGPPCPVWDTREFAPVLLLHHVPANKRFFYVKGGSAAGQDVLVRAH